MNALVEWKYLGNIYKREITSYARSYRLASFIIPIFPYYFFSPLRAAANEFLLFPRTIRHGDRSNEGETVSIGN